MRSSHLLTGRRRAPTAGVAALSVAVYAAALAPGSLAAQAVELRWKFEPGESYVYRQVQTSEMAMPMGRIVQTQTSMLRQDVLSVAGDGAADVRVTTESLRVVFEGPMGRQEWDSASDEPPADPSLRPLAHLVGSSFEMTVAPDGEVRRISGLEGLLDEMTAALPDMDPSARAQTQQMLEGMLGEEGMRSLMQQGMQSFPEEPVAPGAEWGRDMRIPLPFGGMRFAYVYTLRELASEAGSQVAHIDAGGSIDGMEADPANPMAAMMDFTSGELDGDLAFDVNRGILLRASLTSEMVMSVGDQSMTIRSSHEMELVEAGVDSSDR